MISFFSKVDLDFSNWEKLESWVNFVVAEEGFFVGEVSVVFMSDIELLDYNVKFLNHNFLTDVITFDEVDHKMLGGDILISVDRIRDNSVRLNVPFHEEFGRVVVHGFLHLCGYNDKAEEEKKIMRSKENYYLSQKSFT